jgi:uncharacterized protein (DUF1501 family)
MKRREFLTRAVPASTLPFLMGGFSVMAYGRSSILDALLGTAAATDRVLVLVQLNGGNDGLNTVIPLDQYSALANARSNILIPQNKVLSLATATGLHPALGPDATTGRTQSLFSLYNDGKVTVVQSVGYPNPSFSHFRATDIWLTASDANVVLASGWLGRYLDLEYPGYPLSYPSTAMPDPLAIQIGSVVSPGLQGPSVSMGLAIANPNSTYILPGGPTEPPPNTPAGHELTFLRTVAEQTQQYSSAVKGAAGKATNKSTLYPTAGQNSLADQLKVVAQLIAGGLKTRIYVVNLGGFDTHSAQVASTGGTETGFHATLLNKLSLAIAAFQDDLHLLGIEDRVIGMTFSEFGRRIKSNGALGTDHGSAAPLFLFGTNVNGSIIGSNPTLPVNALVSDNIPLQFDFRSVYMSLLRDWFGATTTELQASISGTITKPLTTSVVKSSALLGAEENKPIVSEYTLEQNYPNPFNPSTTIRYALPQGANVRLEVFNTAGQRVAILVDSDQSAGVHEIRFDAGNLASGAYFYTLHAGESSATKKLLLVR